MSLFSAEALACLPGPVSLGNTATQHESNLLRNSHRGHFQCITEAISSSKANWMRGNTTRERVEKTDKELERESQMEREMESWYHVTGGHGAGQCAEWAIRGQHNRVVMAGE